MPEELVQLSIKARAKPQAAFADAPSRPYWRSLADLEQSPEFVEYVHREFPVAASEWHDPVSRRNFLKLMGASLALAGVYGCQRGPEETIVPYVQPPEQLPGSRTVYFATAMPFDGYGRGLLVESYQGRPIKVEGNPSHPASLGATDTFAQASLLNLYDPDRSQNVLEGGQISTWAMFLNQVTSATGGEEAERWRRRADSHRGITSPTLADQLGRFLEQYPQARWHSYQPVNRDNAAAGARQAFGRPVNAVYDFSRAQVILSIDSNFLVEEPGSLRYARQFMDGRRLRMGGDAERRPGLARGGAEGLDGR